MRVALAEVLIEFIRKRVVPSGHNWKYALRRQVLHRVNALNLEEAPIFDGETLVGVEHRRERRKEGW
jgi:hypothetical protein